MSYVPPEPPPMPPVVQRHRKRRVWPWVVGLVVVAVLGIAVAGNHGTSGGGTSPTGVPAGNDVNAPAAPAAPSMHTIVYSVTGNGGDVDVTYNTDGSTTINQESNVSLPWTKTITLPADQSFEIAQLEAQGASEGATVHVTITVDGTLAKSASATGYGVASADYTIPD